jgi:L-ascorbate metabolism protein UlaG (beta-lactamase superfamily)
MLTHSFAILALFVASASANEKRLTLRWHGQSYFDLETSQGTRIAFDPHAIEAYGRILVKADLVLVSHLHNDHTQVDVIDNPSKKVIQGLVMAGRRAEWNTVDEKFRDVRIRAVGAYHDGVQGLEKGKNTVFLVEADGLRIAHLGDLGHVLTEDQVKKIGPVDVLLIPVGGVYTLNGSEAKKVVDQLKPSRYIVPMHYGTKEFEDLLPIDEFLDEQPRESIKSFPTTNKLVIEANAPPPPRPTIAVLNWK